MSTAARPVGVARTTPSPTWRAEELERRLLHRDGLVLVIDKPAGLPVHAGPKGGPNLEHYLDALRFGYPRRPALAHRLDRDTSGCLVLGRHPAALRRLGRLFAEGRVEKTYWAIVLGRPAAAEGRIEAPLAKRSALRGWWMKVDPAGQPAVTLWRLLGASDELAWLELRPLTGRTHQIRVHLNHKHHPVVGDPLYGGKGPTLGLDRQFLHAQRLGFARLDGDWVEFASPLPLDLQAVLDRLRAQYAPPSINFEEFETVG